MILIHPIRTVLNTKIFKIKLLTTEKRWYYLSVVFERQCQKFISVGETGR